MSVQYKTYKDLAKSIREVYQRGGLFQKAAETVQAIMGRIKLEDKDPFQGIPLTNHGESRIQHCVKYDLSGRCRLITIQDSGVVLLCFLGNHDESEKWLTRNNGMKIVVGDEGYLPVSVTNDIGNKDTWISRESDYSNGYLYQKLPERVWDALTEEVKRSTARRMESLESISTDEEIEECILACETNTDQQECILDVLVLLRAGDVDGAKHRVDLYRNELIALSQADDSVKENAPRNDHITDVSEVEYLFEHFVNNASFMDWMLYMNADQRVIVDSDYRGSVNVSGVSGSGKTCVIVKRAIRLASKYDGCKILIVTLNPALATLITQMVNYACPNKLRDQIAVMSLWSLCQSLIAEIDPVLVEKRYTNVTWKTGEELDEVWEEYYDYKKQKQCNNVDAHEILFPWHQELLVRNVFPMTYVKEEYDYVRSARVSQARQEYEELERKGRRFGITADNRAKILQGLMSWEQKMDFVGVVDELGIANAVLSMLGQVKRRYRCALVDESQDFGTNELRIIRSLVEEGENDLFMCGDIVQRVSTKHHDLKDAGITITERPEPLKKNYRNSREILACAYDVLQKSAGDSFTEDDYYEHVVPTKANYSTPRPLLLSGTSLDDEIAHAFAYISESEKDRQDGKSEDVTCIAVCGKDRKFIRRISEKYNVVVLDEKTDVVHGGIVVSDLARVKGYEFDRVIILNASKNVIPDPMMPAEEKYRELSRLYVAMTRAKRELILSYTESLSEFLEQSLEYFTEGAWNEYMPLSGSYEIVENNRQSREAEDAGFRMYDGLEFLYTRDAVGMPRNLQDKMVELVGGKNRYIDGKQIEWKCINELLAAAKVNRSAIGTPMISEILAWFKR